MAKLFSRCLIIIFTFSALFALIPTISSAAVSQIWTGPDGGTVQELAIDPNNNSTIFAGTKVNGIFKSTDKGDNWTAVNNGLTNLNVQAIAFDPNTPGTVFAGTRGGGVFKSTSVDNPSWTAVNTNLTNLNVQALLFDPNTPGTVYGAQMGAECSKAYQLTIPTGVP
jgi:photosystem II stability/assembly factor-like uncharacterized protein